MIVFSKEKIINRMTSVSAYGAGMGDGPHGDTSGPGTGGAGMGGGGSHGGMAGEADVSGLAAAEAAHNAAMAAEGNMPPSVFASTPQFNTPEEKSVALALVSKAITGLTIGAENLAKTLGVTGMFGPAGIAAGLIGFAVHQGVKANEMDEYVSEKMAELGFQPNEIDNAVAEAKADPDLMGALSDGLDGGGMDGKEAVEEIKATETEEEKDTGGIKDFDRKLWDEFMDAWDGTPSYAQTKAKESFQRYFDTAKPGDTQSWAGGTITMGGDGKVTYTPPTGDPVQFTRDSDMKAMYENYPEIARIWDAEFPTMSMKDTVEQHSNYLKDAANRYTDTIQTATDTQTQNLDSLMSQLSQATNRNDSFLQSQIDAANAGTGYFKPVTFMLGDQEISFVPGANRSLAEQLAQNSQNQLAGIRNYTTDARGMGQDRLANIQGTANNIFATAPVTSPAASDLAYLQTLMTALPQEELRRQSDLDEIYRNNALAQGLAISNNQLKAQEPGWLDWVKGAGSLLNTVGQIQVPDFSKWWE